MAKLNKILRAFTHEGARAKRFTPEQELKRALMNCLLWEDQFYEDGVTIADRIKALVPLVEPARVAAPRHRGARRHEAAPCAAPGRARDGAARKAPRAGRRHAGARDPASRRDDGVSRHLLGRRARTHAAAQEAAGLARRSRRAWRAPSPSSTPISSPSTTATVRCA
ncbi:MAG: hypothetical protein WDM81_14945 [Rhizomicrobium sp.]